MAWTLNHRTAHFKAHGSQLSIELGSPLRLSILSQGHAHTTTVAAFEIVPHEASVPSTVTLPTCTDGYIRQRDLIASYAQDYPWPFGFQIDFRSHASGVEGIEAQELWLSVQTSLLTSHPQLWLKPLADSPTVANGDVIVSTNQHVALMIHPLDREDCRQVTSSHHRLDRVEAFGRFMEKGVIRRARILLAWSAHEVEAKQWHAVCERFADSPLPLTA